MSRFNIKISDWLNRGLFIILIILFLIPILTSFIISIESNSASLSTKFRLLPGEFSLEGYDYLFKNINFLKPLLNTVYMVVISVSLHLIITGMIAYALAKKDLKYNKHLTTFTLITMAIPAQILMLPRYIMFKELNLLNSLNSLIIISMASGFSILLLKTYFETVPKSLGEAARMVGASEFYIFRKVYIPMAKPGFITIMLFQVVSRWNEFTQAAAFINKPEKYVIQQALRSIIFTEDTASGMVIITPNIEMAAIVIAMIPILIFYLLAQKYFVQGKNLGAIKG